MLVLVNRDEWGKTVGTGKHETLVPLQVSARRTWGKWAVLSLAVVTVIALLSLLLSRPSGALPSYVVVRGDFSRTEAVSFYADIQRRTRQTWLERSWFELRRLHFPGAWYCFANGPGTIIELDGSVRGGVVATVTNRHERFKIILWNSTTEIGPTPTGISTGTNRAILPK